MIVVRKQTAKTQRAASTVHAKRDLQVTGEHAMVRLSTIVLFPSCMSMKTEDHC